LSEWAKGIVTWRESIYLCVSVPFTWLLKDARAFCLQHPSEQIVVGGPAVRLLPNYLATIPNVVSAPTFIPDNPLRRANPNATRTTSGCPNSCPFCGVETIEGKYTEILDWRVAPVLCDSNFLASSDRHFNQVIDRLKQADFDEVDFNQGLDARLFTRARASRLAEIRIRPRFAWDNAGDEAALFKAVETAKSVGLPVSRLPVYCLVGWQETPEEAQYRLELLKERHLRGFAMRYQPLDTLEKNSYWPSRWDPDLLKDFIHYWNRQAWLGGMTLDEYRAGAIDARQAALAL